MKHPYLLDFGDPRAVEARFSGGKGANLARLTQAGFPVPSGWIVPTEVYREFLGELDLPSRLRAFPFEDAAGLRKAAASLRQELDDLPLPAGLEGALETTLASRPGLSFGVRSSSNLEDLAGAAFAGQHDTFLNCHGAEEILEKIKRCFLSLWHDRAMAYRHQQGFDQDMAAMAVVIQEMAPCEVAGVAFSVNPINGRLDEIIIDANWGLGESVVSGETEVDHFILNKADGVIKSANIAQKSQRIVSRDGGGVQHQPIGAEEASAPCLSKAECADLCALLRSVENHYGFPQDIEWGLVKGELVLLQSRPITAIAPRWTRDESAERFPNVITPLTWDFVDAAFHQSLKHSFELLSFPTFDGKWFALKDHYVYGDQNAVALYANHNPLRGESLDDLRALIPELGRRYAWVQQLPDEWHRELDHYLIGIGELMAEPLEGKSLSELWAYAQRVNTLGAEYFLPNIAISISQASLCRFILSILSLIFGEEEARRRYDELLSFCATKTGMINAELYEMAGMIRQDPSLAKHLVSRDSKELTETQALDDFPSFASRFKRFLRDHGHRELDFDTYHPTWIEAPWAVLDNLKLISKADDHGPPLEIERAARKRQQKAEFDLLQHLPEDLHFFCLELLRLARTYTSLDDLEHYQTTRLSLPMRRGLRVLGERLQVRNVLKEPMDIFFCRAAELENAIQRDEDRIWKALSRSIAENKTSYLQAAKSSPDWVYGESETIQESGPQIQGIPGSAGRAEGPVFIVSSPDDFADFPSGSVLVARTTNPAWTPLFYSAVAVITESGGPLSHGAVTAREMGIPAVMSVRGCLSWVKSGDLVLVDGSDGLVVKR